MHPAGSVIGFTVASGAGYGMLAVIGLLAAMGRLEADEVLGFIAMSVAIALVTGGLLSSTFHLGHPERAWRAFSQWRSSWLSREGVASVVTYVPAAVLGWFWVIEGDVGGEPARIAGVALMTMSLVTIFCTAMIYRSLKPVPAWSNRFTVPAYLSLGLASGLVAIVTLFGLAGVRDLPLLWAAVFASALGLLVKHAYWRALDSGFAQPSRESATGLTFAGAVRPFEDPHSSDNYLMKEMGFRVGRKHAGRLRAIARHAGFSVPAALLAVAGVSLSFGMFAVTTLAASLLMAVGLTAERWLFFAEARHVVTLYYRDRPTVK